MMIIKIAGQSGSGKSQIANFLQTRLSASHPALNIFAALGGAEWWSNK